MCSLGRIKCDHNSFVGNAINSTLMSKLHKKPTRNELHRHTRQYAKTGNSTHMPQHPDNPSGFHHVVIAAIRRVSEALFVTVRDVDECTRAKERVNLSNTTASCEWKLAPDECDIVNTNRGPRSVLTEIWRVLQFTGIKAFSWKFTNFRMHPVLNIQHRILLRTIDH